MRVLPGLLRRVLLRLLRATRALGIEDDAAGEDQNA